MGKANPCKCPEASDPHLDDAKSQDTSSRAEKVTEHPKSAGNMKNLNGASRGLIVLGVDALNGLSPGSTTNDNIVHFRKTTINGLTKDAR